MCGPNGERCDKHRTDQSVHRGRDRGDVRALISCSTEQEAISSETCSSERRHRCGSDLCSPGLLLLAWGSDDYQFDLNADGIVDGSIDGGDLGLLLLAWGVFPPQR